MAGEGQSYGSKLSLVKFFRIFLDILKPEANFYWLAAVYGIGISLLSLATPISVQMLINTIANTAMRAPLVVLTLTLFGLLLISSLLYALRVHLMEIFARRFYARMVAEISLISVYAQNPFFSDVKKGPLFNRYFDVVYVQTAIPILFIGGFTTLLQIAVGFVLVSLYHPYFLGFTLVMIALIWIVWLAWGARALRTGVDVSHAKHATAAWLESIGGSNGFFKSQRRIDYALDKTDDHTRDYIVQRKRHFRHLFSQTIAFLVMYAAASAALLGLGGWLVIENELTLGQLVAAELVLSAAFLGVSQLGSYLGYFYDLFAAVEEISHFYDVEQEQPKGADPFDGPDHTIVMNGVRGKARHEEVQFDLEIPSGAIIMASASHHGVQRLFTNLLKMHELPKGGIATLGDIDMKAIEAHHLRKNVHVLDRPSIVEMTIREYLALSCPDTAPQRMLGALETVGLAGTIATLEKGLDTPLAATGFPLSAVELQQLKLANALLERPRILVLSRLFDLLEPEPIARAVAELRSQAYSTVIYFSGRRIDLGFDRFLYLEARQQRYFGSFEEFTAAKTRSAPPPGEPLSKGDA
ncbi:ABC transporter transmembrane domain-containing protein [Porphyrobacter sp. CACIAM 03H1]|uniref:ABC transporter transmembrane domain-containing protein n=1 Tax=Porphyrobacter sp. CACIAM 03H1 TaxID=2003315 RepID=UPI000B5AA781|nr:ABC transporter transmembrane domain-containing protein [Porphyrobacter sp. CACIAM 03H1]ASJ92136.1 ABC transporter ATP-binding protein [Porphyrobacter sp. CACIAM 03H1]